MKEPLSHPCPFGSTERRGSPNLFEITDRVEMGQMASMFFSKGTSSSFPDRTRAQGELVPLNRPGHLEWGPTSMTRAGIGGAKEQIVVLPQGVGEATLQRGLSCFELSWIPPCLLALAPAAGGAGNPERVPRKEAPGGPCF